MKTIIVDNFLSQVECHDLINFYKENEKFAKKFRDVYPLGLLKNNPKIHHLKLKLNETSKDFNAEIDWFEIVKWPIGSKQGLHFDMAKNHTILSSIVYLNDNFEGGQTYFEEGTIFKPKMGRGLFFNGQYYKHGVNTVEQNIRYVVAAWYKKLYPIS